MTSSSAHSRTRRRAAASRPRGPATSRPGGADHVHGVDEQRIGLFPYRLKGLGRMADGVNNPMRVDTSLLQGITAANNAAVKAKSSSLKIDGDHHLLLQRPEVARPPRRRRRSPSKARTTPRSSRVRAPACTSTRPATRVTARPSSSSRATTAREQHIYGTGQGPQGRLERWRRSPRRPRTRPADKSRPRRRRPSKAPANEKTKQVDGRAYADILNGSRYGLYLNTSGNVRDGQVFTLVKREGREFHIYGTGKDREIIGLRPKPDDDARRRETTPSTDRQDGSDRHVDEHRHDGAGTITDGTTT